jgi:hypothetical protein
VEIDEMGTSFFCSLRPDGIEVRQAADFPLIQRLRGIGETMIGVAPLNGRRWLLDRAKLRTDSLRFAVALADVLSFPHRCLTGRGTAVVVEQTAVVVTELEFKCSNGVRHHRSHRPSVMVSAPAADRG